MLHTISGMRFRIDQSNVTSEAYSGRYRLQSDISEGPGCIDRKENLSDDLHLVTASYLFPIV